MLSIFQDLAKKDDGNTEKSDDETEKKAGSGEEEEEIEEAEYEEDIEEVGLHLITRNYAKCAKCKHKKRQS